MHLSVGTLWKYSDEYHRNSFYPHGAYILVKRNKQVNNYKFLTVTKERKGAAIQRTSEMYFIVDSLVRERAL